MSGMMSQNPKFGSSIDIEDGPYAGDTQFTENRRSTNKYMIVAGMLGFTVAIAGTAVGTFVAGMAAGKAEIQATISGSLATGCVGACQEEASGEDFLMPEVMKIKLAAREKNHAENAGRAAPASQTGKVVCRDGESNGYPCKNVDFLSFTSIRDMGGGSSEANDIWGWTDPATGREYAIVGMESGTGVVDVTSGENPNPLAFIPSTNSRSSPWRDVKVYSNHAFIGSEARGHGMQVFDLTRVRGLTSLSTLQPDTTYTQFGNSHNIVINEESGFAFAVGSNTCRGGLHMVNIKTPKNPSYAGCFDADGYTHDAQCVIYRGPDSTYQGRELCFAYNEDTLTIVDVTNKQSPTQISRTRYTGSAYSHQGWLTEDQKYLLLDDELDEQRGNNNGNTMTYVWDVQSLNNPVNIYNYQAPVKSIDHNLYIKGNLAFQSNYESGLRITDVSDVANKMEEVAFFDVHPQSDRVNFAGSWSNYPYFASGNVIVSSIETGLFVLKPMLSSVPTPPVTQAPTPVAGTDAPTGGPALPAECECDGGNGTYEQCVFYNPFSNNVCFLAYTGTADPQCPLVGNRVRYAFSNNFSRWYVVGCDTTRSPL